MGERMKKCMTCLALLGIVLLPMFLDSDTDPKKLEARLEGSTGKKRVEILIRLTEAYRRSASKKAVQYGEEALELLRTDSYKVNRAALLHNISYAALRLGECETAEKYAKQSLDIAQKSMDKKGHADALYLLGRSYRRRSIYNRAMDYYTRA